METYVLDNFIVMTNLWIHIIIPGRKQCRANVYDQNDSQFKEENMKIQLRHKVLDDAFPFRGPDLLCPLVRGKHKIENVQRGIST
jgi:hypothetical protein